MTEEELQSMNFESNSIEQRAQYIIYDFESRFPDLLKNDSRYLLFNFIINHIINYELRRTV